MKEAERKIKRILRTPSVFNWTRLNYERTDETAKAVKRFAESDHQISLKPVYSLCTKLAQRDLGLNEAYEKISEWKGYAGQAAFEIIPIFHNWLELNQIQTVDIFDNNQRISFPIGRWADGSVLSIPLLPNFFTMIRGRPTPVYILGWSSITFNYYQIQLCCSIIKKSVLSYTDLIGSDAKVITFSKDKWSGLRIQGEWSVNKFGTLQEEVIHDQMQRYFKSLSIVIDQIRGE